MPDVGTMILLPPRSHSVGSCHAVPVLGFAMQTEPAATRQPHWNTKQQQCAPAGMVSGSSFSAGHQQPAARSYAHTMSPAGARGGGQQRELYSIALLVHLASW